MRKVHPARDVDECASGFKLALRPPSGVASTLTLIRLREIPRPEADERKHAAQWVCQTGSTFTKYTPLSLTFLSSQPRMRHHHHRPHLHRHHRCQEPGSVLVGSSSSLPVGNMKNKTGSKLQFNINHSGPVKLEPPDCQIRTGGDCE